MAGAFLYNVRGFKATWCDLMKLFEILDHTAMTTASHLYIRHRPEQWSDAKKIDFAIDIFIEADQQWVLEALTRPGAENITTIVVAGEYLSTHVPEDGPVGDGVTVHALTRGRRGGPIQCYGCQETGHVIANCPHRAQGASALGATLAYNLPCTPHQRSDTSAQDMARKMEVTAFRRLHWRSAAWTPAPRNFSNCASASNWLTIGSLQLQLRSEPPERYRGPRAQNHDTPGRRRGDGARHGGSSSL